jgi:hypothetical protein
MLYLYYPSKAVNHLQELAILAKLRASMQPAEKLIILPASRPPYIVQTAIDHGLTFELPSNFFDGKYFYFYGKRFSFEELEQTSFAHPTRFVYDYVIIANAIPQHSPAKQYFLSLNHTAASKSILRMIKQYTRANNTLIGLESINLLPTDLITVIWDVDNIKAMEQIMYISQNANVYNFLTYPSQNVQQYLFDSNKRFFSFDHSSKFIADFHALFQSKVVLSLKPDILQSLGFQVYNGDGFYYSISTEARYNF